VDEIDSVRRTAEGIPQRIDIDGRLHGFDLIFRSARSLAARITLDALKAKGA
jgi:hypothetical protein